MSERIVYKFETEEGQYITLVANGPVTRISIVTLEGYIRRQKRRFKENKGPDLSEPLSRPA